MTQPVLAIPYQFLPYDSEAGQRLLREVGQDGTSSLIRNYLGFPRGVSGRSLAQRASNQAILFGAELVYARATALRPGSHDRVVTLADGSEVVARTVIIATGAAYRRLDAPGVEELLGAGVFYGAAVSEAPAMTGRDVVVVGAGNSAGQAALHLAKYADRVTMLVRRSSS
jgi:thioredoxin reductase (NADPH)